MCAYVKQLVIHLAKSSHDAKTNTVLLVHADRRMASSAAGGIAVRAAASGAAATLRRTW